MAPKSIETPARAVNRVYHDDEGVAMSITNTTATTTEQPYRTSDSFTATCILAGDFAILRAIEGELGNKVFVFDRPLPASVILSFNSSPARRVLDVYKNLMRSIHGRTD
jgi:hypothetical protein